MARRENKEPEGELPSRPCAVAELLVDAMVIASSATIGDLSLGGFGYYEGGLWNGGFGGCLVEASELAPVLSQSP